MEERALALDEEQVPALGALVHQPLRGAGHVVGDHVVDGDAPAGDRHAGLTGGDVHRAQPALARRAVELERHDLLADHGVRADAVHHPHRPARLPGPAARSGRAGRRAGRAAPRRARSAAAAQLGIVGQLRVQAGLEVEARPRSPRAGPGARPGRACRRWAPRRSAAWWRRARSPRRRRPRSAPAAGRRARPRAAVRPACGGVDDRDHLAVAVADHAVGGLAVVLAKRPSAKMASRSLTRAPRPGPGARSGSTRPSRSSSPVNGWSASSRCPSRST